MKNLLAQTVDLHQIESNSGVNNGLKGFFVGTTLGDILTSYMPWIFTIAGMLLLVYLIFGGLQLMLSGGDPKAAAGAKSHIGNALIGFLIIFIAYWVVQLFGIVLGLQGIKTVFR